MSLKVQSLVWEFAPYRGNTLLAFLALADWSNDEGVSWPKMSTLAKKSRQSVRSAQYAVETLVAEGYLSVDLNPGRGNENHFRINMQKLHLLQTEKVQTATVKGANGDTKRCKTRHRNKEERLGTVINQKTERILDRERRDRESALLEAEKLARQRGFKLPPQRVG